MAGRILAKSRCTVQLNDAGNTRFLFRALKGYALAV
jgi:hypothetical protein